MTVYVRAKTKPSTRLCRAQIWGRVPKNVCNIEHSGLISKWNKFGTTARQIEQSGEKGIGQGGDQEPDSDSDRAPEFLCEDGITFQFYYCCSTVPKRPLW